jgi:glucose-1-phosphate thymidylyltransferase
MKGIVLAGGTGSRLWPITHTVSKQLLPIYDKPMIYYPISTLMLAGIREILIITTPQDQALFQDLLGNGSRFGVSFEYAVQDKPKGLAQALSIGAGFLANDSCLLILGDNIFHGVGLGAHLKASLPKSGAHIFTYSVSDPSQYGILTTLSNGEAVEIVEKPQYSNSKLAITGLYFLDSRASEFALKVQPSSRGELEITSLLAMYLSENELTYTPLSRGTAWLDTGSPSALNDASQYIRVIEERTGLKIACLEEIAFKSGWISKDYLLESLPKNDTNSYIKYLKDVLENDK